MKNTLDLHFFKTSS